MKKNKLDLINKVLIDLQELQILYFDNDDKFFIIQDIILRYLTFVNEELMKVE